MAGGPDCARRSPHMCHARAQKDRRCKRTPPISLYGHSWSARTRTWTPSGGKRHGQRLIRASGPQRAQPKEQLRNVHLVLPMVRHCLTLSAVGSCKSYTHGCEENGRTQPGLLHLQRSTQSSPTCMVPHVTAVTVRQLFFGVEAFVTRAMNMYLAACRRRP